VTNYVDRAIGFVRGRWSVLARVWNHPFNRGSSLLAIRDYFLWNAVRSSMDGRHVVHLPSGLEIILGRKENYGSSVYTHFLSDYAELLFLTHCLRSEDLFVDIGANVGMYSIWVAGSTGAHVICFEPVPETFLALNQNIRLNCLDRLIDPCQLAIGDADGEIMMTAYKGALDHAIDTSDRTHRDTGTRVPLKSLDSVLPERTPFALKIDVEGYELRVLKGGKRMLRDPALKIILIEVQDWTLHKFCTSKREVLSVLKSYEFESYAYDPFRRKLTLCCDNPSLNHLLIRPQDQPAIDARLRVGPRVFLPGYPKGV
jgi:FkbM family methyltransferase